MFKCPKVLIKDNGFQLTSKSVKNVLLITEWIFDITQTIPQTNPSERAIYVYKRWKLLWERMLKTITRIGTSIYIPQIGCVLRTTTHESTKSSPYFANFGQEMVLSGDVVWMKLLNLWNKTQKTGSCFWIRDI